MTKIKKAMSAERRHDVVPTVVEIVDGDNMSSAYLARILKKAELDISFMSPVNLNSVGDIMEMYDGRDVYVQENGETSNPVFYHGRLDIDVMSQMKYSIKTCYEVDVFVTVEAKSRSQAMRLLRADDNLLADFVVDSKEGVLGKRISLDENSLETAL